MSRRKSEAYRRTEESLEQISVFSVTEVKMKWTRVALAAAVVIACVCFLQTAAVPFTQVSVCTETTWRVHAGHQ